MELTKAQEQSQQHAVSPLGPLGMYAFAAGHACLGAALLVVAIVQWRVPLELRMNVTDARGKSVARLARAESH